MKTDNADHLRAELHALCNQLEHWLIEAALPLWSTQGMDRVRGGFHERLDQQGRPVIESRRARVQPRQVYCFARGASFGWRGDVAALIDHGLRFFAAKFRLHDPLAITLIDARDLPEDSRIVLYDHAFQLLALAHAASVPGVTCAAHPEAERLRSALLNQFRLPVGGFVATLPKSLPLQSNPHMHLFEACLAWVDQARAAGSDASVWQTMADDLAHLALQRFIDPVSGALRENFDATWQPAAGTPGRIVEPGHQFEWAWLLLRWSAASDSATRRTALRLIDIGEQHGVRDGFAINSLLDDFSVHDANARLWPQTERIKATASAARHTGDARYLAMSRDAVKALLCYLDTPVPGLWFDKRLATGAFVDEPAPASTFYHIVAAIDELRMLLSSMAAASTLRADD